MADAVTGDVAPDDPAREDAAAGFPGSRDATSIDARSGEAAGSPAASLAKLTVLTSRSTDIAAIVAGSTRSGGR